MQFPDTDFAEDNEGIDEYIARVGGSVKRMRLAYATAKSQSNPRLQEMPRELTMFFQRPPPEIHTEFKKLREWPDGIDATFASKVLYRAYLDASVNPWLNAHGMRDGTFFESLKFDDRMKRWHGIGAMEILRARGSMKCGDIVDGREAHNSFEPTYHARMRTSFANNPNRAEYYYFGTTHVAMGFNDFSSLLAATLSDKLHHDVPLNWVGFDMSEFAVAKGKVVAHMLGSSNVAISSVMEVWLSSTWSETTLKNFRESVNVVVDSLGPNENPKVLSYLTHWAAVEPVSAARARSAFFLNLAKYRKMYFSGLCSFHRQIDRLDLTQYMLSGEILASSNAKNLMEEEEPRMTGARTNTNTDTVETGSTATGKSASKKKKSNRKKKNKKKKNVKKTKEAIPSFPPLVGNVTMWNVPPDSLPLRDDVAFNTVDFMNVLEDYIEQEKKQESSCSQLSVVDLFIIHIMKNLNRLRGLMLAHKLKIEVNYGVIKAVRGEAANEQLLARIALMGPETMSWSNLVDLFSPEDFHDIARRCSMRGRCVHYGYSMNWSSQVFGMSIMDLHPAHNKPMIDAVLNSAFGFPNEAIPLPPIMAMIEMGELDKLLSWPFREHPLNSTAFVLAQMFNDEWIEHFTKKGKLTNRAQQRLGALCTLSNSGLQIGAMDLAMPCPLYRSTLTLHMSWCYDPRIDLVGNPFESSGASGAMQFNQLMSHLNV